MSENINRRGELDWNFSELFPLIRPKIIHIMKNINYHLVAFFVVLAAVFSFNWQFGNETMVFFGFAENKEMEIRLENPVIISKIYVTPGSKVYEGDILMEVSRSALQLTQSDLNHEVAKLQSELHLWRGEIQANISRLKAQKQVKMSEINTQIEQLESEMNINQSLIKDLKSIQPAKDDAGKSPYQIRVEGLKEELKLAVKPLDAEIRKLQSELAAEENPLKIQIDKLSEELGFVEEEEGKLTVYATGDGIVGSVMCKVGEQIPAFATLMTFYEENPTQVKGYVLENLMLKVNMGDTISVHASVKDNSPLKGVVIGMGSRIVEIPERLRKNPVYKTYGREVIIKIPYDNNFLQSEKVTLKIKEKYDPFSFRQFSAPVTASMVKQEKGQADQG